MACNVLAAFAAASVVLFAGIMFAGAACRPCLWCLHIATRCTVAQLSPWSLCSWVGAGEARQRGRGVGRTPSRIHRLACTRWGKRWGSRSQEEPRFGKTRAGLDPGETPQRWSAPFERTCLSTDRREHTHLERIHAESTHPCTAHPECTHILPTPSPPTDILPTRTTLRRVGDP